MTEVEMASRELMGKEIIRQQEEKEQLYRALFENNPDAVFALDLEGCLINGNAVCTRISGYETAELLHEPVLPLIVPEMREKTVDHFRKALLGERIEYETTMIHKNGERVDLYVKHFPIIVDQEIVGVFGIARDITHLNRRTEEWRVSEERYRLITENSLDLISKLSPDGFILYTSPACRTLLGYDPEELIGRKVLEWLHPEDVENLRERFVSQIRLDVVTSITCRLRAKAGHYIWFETSCKTRRHEKSGDVVEIVAVSRDITERQKTQELLQNSEKLSLVGQLAAGIAHEIRNPLTALKGFLQLMQQNGQEKQEYYTIMASELTRIERIVSELLVLAKPHTAQFQKKEIQQLIQHVVTLIETEAIMKNVEITVNQEGELPPIRCDENQLKQAFINFLKNAIDAMPNGGPVQINIRRVDDQVLIQIIDQGFGIPEEAIEKLGQPFFTTKESGTGLGLMISYKIIEHHQGKVRLTSRVNEGTIVEVFLPVHNQ